MLDLQESRKQIDKIDKEILELFEDRMKLAKEVAEYKRQTGKKVFDKQRELEKLNVLTEMASNEFNKHGIGELFTQIMSMSRKLQYGLIETYSEDLSFELVDHIKTEEKAKVVFFGVKGTYTEQAMEEYFGKDIESFNEVTFKKVMQAVKEGRADYGVLPIENSSTGGITDIYDLLVDYDNYIVGEHVVMIDNVLLGLPGANINDLKIVYSHPQPLMQCAQFLDQHDYIEKKEYHSTAASAEKVVKEKDVTQAAIASRRTGDYYGLEVLAENINFDDTNSTRFIIITNKRKYLTNSNKVSICFELPHESGTLYNMLSHFIYNNLNMTKIESRPIKGKRWEYRFFVDFEGNLGEAGVKNAINGIQEEAVSLKILGNYPAITEEI